MLNKKICKKCINEQKDFMGRVWNNDDEDFWKIGRMLCPTRFRTERYLLTHINKIPPEKCPYRLEQILKGANENGTISQTRKSI